jgi:hypothetical protein
MYKIDWTIFVATLVVTHIASDSVCSGGQRAPRALRGKRPRGLGVSDNLFSSSGPWAIGSGLLVRAVAVRAELN